MTIQDVRRVVRLAGDVRDLRADPQAARQRIADAICELLHGIHAFTLDLVNMTPEGNPTARQMVIGGHPDEKGLRYLFESQRDHHFQHIDPTTRWACRCPQEQAAARNNDMFPRSVWEKHPYFTEHYRPAGLGPLMIGFYRREKPGEALGLSIARPAGDRTFTARERKVLALFVDELVELRRRGFFDAPHAPTLTPRQRQVLKELLAGMSLKQAARHLGMSRYTVEDHVKCIYRRFGVNSRPELLAKLLTSAAPRENTSLPG